ncbi:MAG: glycoside hydrolase family 76 protein, partial [Sphingobacterium sp.]
MKIFVTTISLLILTFNGFGQENRNLPRANAIMDSVYKYYVVPGSPLLREQYPYNETYVADYLGGGENSSKANPYSYLWPFSGSLSAQVAIFHSSGDKQVKKQIDNTVLKGLDAYYDKRVPAGYASYVNSAPESDRFYDDNIWLGIDYTDLFLLTADKKYLQKAKEIWRFVASGMDEKLGGGIYWCEQRKHSKNTCSNAPAIVYLAKLYQATNDKKYLELAQQLYSWTQENLLDKTDNLYFDNVSLDGTIEKTKYPYNSGQMIQAGALLYKITQQKQYLTDAQNVAHASYDYFFYDYKQPATGKTIKLLKTSNNWFIAVMMRGFMELYGQDANRLYVDGFQANLDFAWEHMREQNGLFNS